MIALISIVLAVNILSCSLVVGASLEPREPNSPKFLIVGAGASGIAAGAKLLENGYDNIVILEAENRSGGRVHSIPFGNGYIDLGAQWCEGHIDNVVYELVKNEFEFGDNAIRHDNTHCYMSDGKLVEQSKYAKIMNLSESITYDFANMAKYNKSFGEFFDENYRIGLQDKEFEGVDNELVEQIRDFSEKGMNSLYASESWYDVSAKLSGQAPTLGYEQLTWKERGYKTVFDFLTKKLPDPSKALPLDEKIQLNKEVTNIDWTSNEVVVTCADGSEYRADHVIVTVSLGYLKRHHRTLFTPQLPEKKINAIEHTGYGTLGKIFLEFAEPFWPTNIDEWGAYALLWKQEDKLNITGTKREWLTDVTGFIRQDAQPNLLGAFIAGKHIDQFEGISDEQLIDDCIWLLEKFLGKKLPRPTYMRRSRWKTNKYFLGSYSYGSMATQTHGIDANDLAETIKSDDGKPILLISGEATDELNSGYVHGAVASGWRAANEILNFYKSIQP